MFFYVTCAVFFVVHEAEGERNVVEMETLETFL